MSGKTRSSLLSLAIIAVLIFGAFSPSIAYAQDGTPPPDSPPTEASGGSGEGTSEATSPPAEETPAPEEATSPPEEAAAEPTSVPEETATEPAGEGEAATEEAVEPQPTEAPVVEEAAPAPETSVLEEIPDNTVVTVLDAEGQAQPLATQEAAEAIAENDPIWCPQGQAPTPGANGCTPSFNSIKALLTYMSGNASYSGAGTIYIQEGVYVSGGQNDFNAPEYDLSNIRNSDLTVQGGWNPTTNTLDGMSTFRIPFLIGTESNPWGGALTLNNITIDKSEGTGLVLHSVGDISLSNVTVSNAHDNGSGAELNAGGNVNINNSNFHRNQKAGAVVRAAGDVAIINSSFSNPTAGRAQDVGLDIENGGTVSLFNITANNNREAGATINSSGRVSISTGFFSGTKAFVGTGPASGFKGYGLTIVTLDAIDLLSVTANDNFLWGADLTAGGDVAIADSIFNANTTADPHFIDDTGLLIKSGGFVSLNNVHADDNRLIGATITATGDVSINSSTFDRNNGVTFNGAAPTFHGYGLHVNSTAGNISINMVSASNNTLFGAHLVAAGDVSVSESQFNNQTSGSATEQIGRGLEIVSGGNVFLSGVTLDGNQTFGADIQVTGTGSNIFLSSITATNNGTDGVTAETSCGTVFLVNGNYSNNGGYGLSILNSVLNQTGSPVFANNGAGDIFQDPGTCVFPSPVTPGTTGSAGSGPAISTFNPAQIGLQNAALTLSSRSGFVPSLGSRNASLNSLLASLRNYSGGKPFSIFVGRYLYLYKDGILYVIVFAPEANTLALPWMSDRFIRR